MPNFFAARRPRRRHRVIAEKGNGDALVELLVVHQGHRLATIQRPHQLARADALRRQHLDAIGKRASRMRRSMCGLFAER